MKVDLYLEYRGAPVQIAWAREPSLGVYMGVRFSPDVENASYFRDGQRQLLRFPMMPDGKRRREEVPIDSQSPIPAIQQSELILDRTVKVAGGARSSPSAPKASTETTALTFDEDYLQDYPCLSYEAHIVHNGYAKEFVAQKEGNSAGALDDHRVSIRLFPLDHFPEQSLALIVQRKRSA